VQGQAPPGPNGHRPPDAPAGPGRAAPSWVAEDGRDARESLPIDGHRPEASPGGGSWYRSDAPPGSRYGHRPEAGDGNGGYRKDALPTWARYGERSPRRSSPGIAISWPSGQPGDADGYFDGGNGGYGGGYVDGGGGGGGGIKRMGATRFGAREVDSARDGVAEQHWRREREGSKAASLRLSLLARRELRQAQSNGLRTQGIPAGGACGGAVAGGCEAWPMHAAPGAYGPCDQPAQHNGRGAVVEAGAPPTRARGHPKAFGPTAFAAAPPTPAADAAAHPPFHPPFNPWDATPALSWTPRDPTLMAEWLRPR